jgi:hypothetical protein
VLLMARPTLSRVIYLQQLGRGTRKAAGKECLVVFDFVDNASRYNQGLSLHRILGQAQYRPGALVLGTAAEMAADAAALAAGQRPTAVLPVELWAKGYQEIDVFQWQEAVRDMVSCGDLEVQLSAAEGRIRAAIERGEVRPDHTLPLGDRTYYYFDKGRAEEIRQQLGLPLVTDETLRELFLDFAERMDMASSYKPVMLQSILSCVDEQGRARIADVVATFQRFYTARRQQGLTVERSTMTMARADALSADEVRGVMLRMPFEKFERRKFLGYDRDLAFVRFHPKLWRQLTPADIDMLRAACGRAIAEYYERLGSAAQGSIEN